MESLRSLNIGHVRKNKKARIFPYEHSVYAERVLWVWRILPLMFITCILYTSLFIHVEYYWSGWQWFLCGWVPCNTAIALVMYAVFRLCFQGFCGQTLIGMEIHCVQHMKKYGQVPDVYIHE